MRALAAGVALLAILGVAATTGAQEAAPAPPPPVVAPSTSPAAPVPGAAPGSVALRVVSYNAYGMPYTRARAERVREAARRIGEMRPHLVAMQEVWVEEDAQAVRAVLAAAGLPHSASVASSAPAAVGGSGLLVAAAWPIDDVRFVPFVLGRRPHTPWHVDWMSRKGVLRATVQAPWGSVIVASTHLQADYVTASYQAVRIGQALQLVDAVGARDPGSPLDPASTSRALPVVLAGDLNAQFSDPDFGVLLGAGALTPTAADCDLDAVLVRGGAENTLRPVKVTRVLEDRIELAGEACLLSDHAALLVELEVAPCGAGGCVVGPPPSSAAGAEPPPSSVDRAAVFRQAREVIVAARGSARTLLVVAGLVGVWALAAAVLAFRRAARARRPWLARLGGMVATLAAAYAGWLFAGYAPHALDGFAVVQRRLEAGAAPDARWAP